MLKLALLSSLLLASSLNPPAQGLSLSLSLNYIQEGSEEDHLCLETEPVRGPETRRSALESRVLEGQLLDQYPFTIDKIQEQSQVLGRANLPGRKAPKPDNPVVCVWPLTDLIHEYARLFIAHCFFRGIADRLQNADSVN